MWRKTPREINHLLIIAERRHREELAHHLSLIHLAYHADAKEVNQTVQELEDHDGV